MIDFHDIGLSRGEKTLLHGVSGIIHDGETVGIVGPNGAGKTTLLKVLYKALRADRGNVVVDGDDIAALGRKHIARRMAVVAQHEDNALPLTVKDSVQLGRLAQHNALNYGSPKDQDAVRSALVSVGLDHCGERLISELSGGELQRVLIARAIVQEASHLLLDEPTNHLDIHHQFAILKMVKNLGKTSVVVLHDLNLAAHYCDRVVLLNRGEIVAQGSPEKVFDPALISEIYHIHAQVIAIQGKRHLVFEDHHP
ncbi:ATP-binding cassette domain-containing protein [Corynebacterium poyangense]|uniref:ATP-binding cassette domain-containing protein n=1 Tax=Corynebacterium poyangense TaxID=2684405 RepID=A0A7H0SM00_9CORY|nr:ABC transporter ATP-binding protein [Corynebacterium poyangense]QNQ89575.1 ATP-binding cassette domain-containing protein [Corynebacterium poyangense]